MHPHNNKNKIINNACLPPPTPSFLKDSGTALPRFLMRMGPPANAAGNDNIIIIGVVVGLEPARPLYPSLGVNPSGL